MLHACGQRDYDDLRGGSDAIRPPHYDLRSYIEPFGDALLAADLVVARAGGSMLRDGGRRAPGRCSCPTRTPSADHQIANARWMEAAGAAVVVPTTS